MKEFGQVVENNGNKAHVKILRQSACSKCDKDCHLAGDSHEIEEMNIEVNNTVGAKIGNTVQLEMGEKPLMFAAIIVYLIPLICLIAGYFAGTWFATNFHYQTIENIGIIGSLLSFLISFLIVRFLDSRLRFKKMFNPDITGIID